MACAKPVVVSDVGANATLIDRANFRDGILIPRGDNAALLRDTGMADAANAFVDINTWGTPQQIIEKMEQRRRQIGDFDLTVQVSYGGLSGEQAEKSIRLIAKEVLPEIQSWQTR